MEAGDALAGAEVQVLPVLHDPAGRGMLPVNGNSRLRFGGEVVILIGALAHSSGGFDWNHRGTNGVVSRVVHRIDLYSSVSTYSGAV